MTEKRFIEFMTQNSDDGELNCGFCDIVENEWYHTKDRINSKKCVDLLNNLSDENEQLKKTNDFLSDFRDFITVEHQKTKEENEKLKSDRVRFEEETLLEITRITDKIFEVIDKRIAHYSHEPVSAPVSNPMSVNYDADVDRLARLSELLQLKKELEE